MLQSDYAGPVITGIRFDAQSLQSFGLRTQELRGLGPLVVLAGPNGGGKTRHLQLIEAAVARNRAARDDLSLFRGMAAFLGPDSAEGSEFQSRLQGALRIIEEIDVAPPESPLHAVPLRYESERQLIPGLLRHNRIEQIESASYDTIVAGLANYLGMTARALWDGTHPGAGRYPELVDEHELACRFNEALRELLGTVVEPEFVGRSQVLPRLFDRPFQLNQLSTGQRILISWAILLLRQGGHYKGKILLLDEPEVYLHSDVCVRVIAALQRLVGPEGQIWIATHSLPLIAWAGAESLYFVEDGAATFAGNAPSRVWRSLLGGESSREALLVFLDGDAATAATHFASECLLMPAAAPARPEDPQAKQLAPIVADRLRGGSPVRLLEIGAGRGRLAAAVADLLRVAPELAPTHLTYVAYEAPRLVVQEHRASCETHLADLRTLGAVARYSTNLAELQARDSDRVDLTVLANTLHEIPVEDWLGLFDQIRRASKPDARLLVIEDQEPRIGELPHPRGFLILERNEWRALVDHEVHERVSEHNGRRLTAFDIPVDCLERARANLGRALQLVIHRATTEIQNLRAQPQIADSHRAGRRHAFLAMLHLNATLARQIYPQ
jgi:SAM-dependent methyltransferase